MRTKRRQHGLPYFTPADVDVSPEVLLTAMERYEVFRAHVQAGFTEDQAMALVMTTIFGGSHGFGDD